VNCEQVPFLPAWAVAWVLDDPRKIPYLLIWKSRSDDTVKEAARIAPYYEAAGRDGPDWTGAFEIKRHDGTWDFIRTLLRTLPRNRGRVRLPAGPEPSATIRMTRTHTLWLAESPTVSSRIAIKHTRALNSKSEMT
jgi:hypothetical protein